MLLNKVKALCRVVVVFVSVKCKRSIKASPYTGKVMLRQDIEGDVIPNEDPVPKHQRFLHGSISITKLQAHSQNSNLSRALLPIMIAAAVHGPPHHYHHMKTCHPCASTIN